MVGYSVDCLQSDSTALGVGGVWVYFVTMSVPMTYGTSGAFAPDGLKSSKISAFGMNSFFKAKILPFDL